MIDHINDYVFPAAFSLLPEKMDTPEARVMLLAIGLQESRFNHRAQLGGPARGFFQFEWGGGVRGVLRHPSTEAHALRVCEALRYSADTDTVYRAIEHNDTLACVFARLLLWTLPSPLPTTSEEGWAQYIDAWRPGKPKAETWAGFYEHAGHLVQVSAGN